MDNGSAVWNNGQVEWRHAHCLCCWLGKIDRSSKQAVGCNVGYGWGLSKPLACGIEALRKHRFEIDLPAKTVGL